MAVEEPLIYPLPDRAWLDVSVSALRHNANELRRRTGLPLIPMVKANAYGVGATGVVGALESLDPMAYGVATVAEGESLRGMGIVRPVIVFTPILAGEYARARAAALTLALGDSDAINYWARMGGPYHVAIDTGMSRAGVDWRAVAEIRDAVQQWPPVGAFTHLHSAEDTDGSAEIQVARFFAALDQLGVEIPVLHVDNSAGVARGVIGRREWSAIRPGIFLYGVDRGLGITAKAVVSLRARIVDVRWIEAGDSVSYAASYTVMRKSRIATAAVGYGDGYPRALYRATAILNGSRVPQRGFVTMDMTMFDVTDASCAIGDIVTLIDADDGPGGDMTLEGIARTAEMSPYELLTGFSGRLDRRLAP